MASSDEITVAQWWCNICNWQGEQWQEVESKPGQMTRKACPNCKSYPRDRILYWLLASNRIRDSNTPNILEIGCSPHSYWWKSEYYQYRNADIVDTNAPIDYQIKGAQLIGCEHKFDWLVLSFVLSMIKQPSDRVALLRTLYEVSSQQGTLILFDDIDLEQPNTRVNDNSDFFHPVRFGQSILDEVASAGWTPKSVAKIPSREIFPDYDLPFLISIIK